MEDQHQGHQQQQQQNITTPNQTEKTTTEPVRSRWTPKPEQILILESIFNSGMVNPPKDETVRIRKLLEKFGAVGDANVFYWFQNRRSRSRRRQRQMQQQQQQQQQQNQQLQLGGYSVGGAIQCDQAHVTLPAPGGSGTVGFVGDSSCLSSYLSGSPSSSSSSCGALGGGGGGGGQEGNSVVDGFFSVAVPGASQMGFPEIDQTSSGTSVLYPHIAPNLNFHPGFGGSNNISGIITVFINGIATEVPRGPIDIKTLFGEDVVLVHSSGVPVPTTEYGFLMQTLHHGESYFLVPKPTQG